MNSAVAGTAWPAPARVHVTGAEGSLARRVLALLADDPAVVDGSATASDVVVHLGAGEHDLRARRRENVTDGAAQMLDEANAGRASHLVLVSSAMVYGAYANNPVPLTEDAILRPDVEFVYARQLAAVEALADRWRRAAPGRTVTVLRPVVAMAADGTSSLARALAAGFGHRAGAEDPPAQFLHLDDLASAVVLAVDHRLDGVYNVAPDGWVPGDRVRALTGARPRIRLPDRVAEVVAAVRWRFQRGPIPPGLGSYTREPWLVANDRLKAHGWVADGHQRTGLRRGHGGALVDDDHAQAAPGARARRDGDGVAGGHRRRRCGSPVVAPPPPLGAEPLGEATTDDGRSPSIWAGSVSGRGSLRRPRRSPPRSRRPRSRRLSPPARCSARSPQ